METGVGVREDGVELEFGLEEVEFRSGQDGTICERNPEQGSEESVH